jgi:outer membrane protein assembly factor BamB
VSVLTENDGTVSALNLSTGEVRWSVRLRGPIVAAPAVAGPLVLAADASKTLFALDAASGATRWSVRFRDLVSTAPAVANGVVVVATEDRRVSGLGLQDGRRMWQVRTGALVKALPAISGDRVIVGDEGGTVAALALRDGTPTWETELDSALTAGPVVSGDLVTVTDNAGNLSGYAAGDGTLRWTRSVGAYTLTDIPPAAGGGEVVLVTLSTTGKGYVSAFDGQDGRELWRRAVPGDVRHAPMILGSTVAVLTEQSRLWTFDLSTGAREAEVSFPPVLDSTIDSDSRVALSYVDGALIVTVRTASTEFAWAETTFFALPAPPRTAPGPASQGVYFSSSVRSIPDVWTAPPALLDGDVVFPGFKRVLWGVRPDGSARRLAMSDSPVLFASVADGLVLSNLGDDLVAVDPVTGVERWRVPVGKLLPGASPAVTGGNAIMPVSGLGLVAVALASGDVKWTAPADGVGSGAPLVLPDGDVITALGSLSRLEGANGHEEWSIPDVSTFGSMAYSHGTVFVLAYSSSEVSLLAVDADTHAVSWKQPFNPSLLVGPAAGTGFVVAADQMGLVTAFDARSGTPRWSYSMRSAPCGTPIISGDRVLLTERGRPEDLDEREYRAVVLDLATGRFLGSIEPPGSSGAEGDCGATPDGRIVLPGNLLAQLVTVSER